MVITPDKGRISCLRDEKRNRARDLRGLAQLPPRPSVGV